jgi:hypothetical protein
MEKTFVKNSFANHSGCASDYRADFHRCVF